MNRTSTVLAAVLAGGLGSRIGGAKAMVELGGRPLIAYALDAVERAGLDAVIVAKRDTRLPDLGVPVLTEPPEPRHPLSGVLAALEVSPAVLAVPCDMPFLSPALLAALSAQEGQAAAGSVDGRLAPLPALVRATARSALEAALASEASLRATLRAVGVATLDIGRFGDPERLSFTVNTREDLATAELMLAD